MISARATATKQSKKTTALVGSPAFMLYTTLGLMTMSIVYLVERHKSVAVDFFGLPIVNIVHTNEYGSA